ncbi:putative ribonuclease H-like domain-containing protein [Tanacetum coccineum]
MQGILKKKMNLLKTALYCEYGLLILQQSILILKKFEDEATKALRKEFAQETENLLIQVGATKASSTNIVNTVSTPAKASSSNIVNTVSTPELPSGKKAIGTKWVYRNKKDERGVVVKNKARLVAQGHRQEEGIDYDESAFLYGKIDEEYMVSTTRMDTEEEPLKNSIPYKKDKTCYRILVQVYVDDSIFGSTNEILSMISSLMYLTASRPDIMFAVCVCSRFQVTPKSFHLSAVKRIFRYLKGKPKLGLWYPRVSSFDLEAYSDRDLFLGNAKKQTIAATSTIEAEYVAAASCSGHHFIRDAYEKKLIQVLKIHTDDNVADLLTKAFNVSRSSLGFRESLRRVFDGIEALMLPTLFILWLATISTDSAELVLMGKVSTAIETLKTKIPPRPDGNAEFHEIIDFLMRSSIHHALTGKHFSGKVTPLFASMLVQPTKDEGAPSERPSEAQPTPSPPHPKSSMGIHGGQSSSDKSLSGNEGDMTLQSVYDLCISLCTQVSDQAKEIQHLKAQIKKLKKQAKPVITHHRAWMKSVSLKQRLAGKRSLKKNWMQKEYVSKQGRKSAKAEPSVHKDPLFDEIPEDTLDYMETEDAQDQGRTRDVSNEKKKSTDRPIVSTDGSKVSTDKEKDSTDRTDQSTDDQLKERAQVLLNMSQAKAVSREKMKGIDPKDKWKKKIKEEDESESESDGIPEAEKKFKQLASDEEMARKVQEEWEGNFKHSDLKTKKFEEIQALYEKIKRSDEDFISIGSAEDERLIKEMNEKGIDSSKNKSVKEEDKEEEDNEKKKLLLDCTRVSSPDGDYLVIYRANGNFRAFNYLMEYSEITLEGFELILWGDLKIMMESSTKENDQSDFWCNQQDWRIITWRLYESCGVCILEFEDGIVIHMLVERRYPLSKDLLQRMLDLGLEVERESSVALDLIRFIKQQIDEE